MRSLKATIENCGWLHGWAVQHVNGEEQYVWEEEDSETDDETSDESEQGSNEGTEGIISEELGQTVSEPTTVEELSAMVPEPKHVEGPQASSESASGIQERSGNEQFEGPQASSEPTSATQESSGNGQEQDAVGEPQGMAEEQPSADTIPANGSDTMPEVDVQKNSNGRLAWMLKAGRGCFRWHDLVLAILIVSAFLRPCHSECLES